MGLALWLVPPPAESSLLDPLISSLATTYHAPTFASHLTLLTGIPGDTPTEEVLASVRTAVEEWKGMTARRRRGAREAREGTERTGKGSRPSGSASDASTLPVRPSEPAYDDADSPLPLLSFQALESKANKYFQYLYLKINTSPSPVPSLLDLRHAVRNACIPNGRDTLDDFFPHLSLMYGVDSGEGNEGKAEKIMEELRRTGSVVEEEEACEMCGIRGFRPEEILFIKAEGRPEQWEVLGRVLLL